MKKLGILISMFAAVLGLCACGSEESLTEYEQQKVMYAQQLATQGVIPTLSTYTEEQNYETLSDFTYEELAYVIANDRNLNVDGYAFYGGVESFRSALEEMGGLKSVGESRAEIKDDEILVYVEVEGNKKDAEAEIIFSNDMFMLLESAALNPTASMGELMKKAALNTVIGMGTVFIVLILISLIISAFALIPKLQASLAKKKEKQSSSAPAAGIDNAVAQIVDREEIVNGTDDLELVAVIAAAIAASEGQTSTDGFVVRSIRRRV
ncbi:MAG: OadG family protein [Lachnospiraceae bacterium]|nr:OadG family protein [Lachnospiraceae bacterium]